MKAFSLLIFISLFLQINSRAQFKSGNDYKRFLLSINDSISYNIFVLNDLRKYDSLINFARKGIKDNEFVGDDVLPKYYATLASAFGNKGMADSMDFYVKQYIKVKRMGNFSLADILPFNNYILFYPVASDQKLQDYMLEQVCTEYERMAYPLSTFGRLLIKIKFIDQRDRALDSYYRLNERTNYDSIYRSSIKHKYQVTQTMLLDLYRQHPQYLSDKEVGEPSQYQLLLFRHIADSALVRNRIGPILKNAYNDQKISGTEYVDFLIKDYVYRNDELKVTRYRDSLCKIYKCILD